MKLSDPCENIIFILNDHVRVDFEHPHIAHPTMTLQDGDCLGDMRLADDLDWGTHLGVTAVRIRGIDAHQFEQRLYKLEKVICQNAETHASDTVDDVFERMNILERFFEATRAQENTVMELRIEDMSATLKRMELALSRGGHIASHPVSPLSRRYCLQCHSSIFGCLFRVCFQIFLNKPCLSVS